VVSEDEKCYTTEQEEVEFRDGEIIHTIWVDAADLEFDPPRGAIA